MDMGSVRCLFAARSRFNGEALPVLRGLSGMALSRGSRRHAEASSGNVQEDVGNGVKGLLFGLICRLRARACQGAAAASAHRQAEIAHRQAEIARLVNGGFTQRSFA